MKYVKKYRFAGVDSTLTACIELQAPPNAATEGEVGLLAMDVSSPTHDVYKCVAVNGAVYTWELLSTGMSILSSSSSGNGVNTATFPYTTLRTTENYVVKRGDLILDSNGFLYRIVEMGNTECTAEYCYFQMNSSNGVGISSISQTPTLNAGEDNIITIKLTNGVEHSITVKGGVPGKSAYQVAKENGFEGTEKEWMDRLAVPEFYNGSDRLKNVIFNVSGDTLYITTT